MKRLSFLIAAGGLAIACAGEDPIAPVAPSPPPPPPLPTYVLFGIVQDESGLPVDGASAELVNLSRVTVTNDSGYFSFAAVRGPVTIRVQKEGFGPQLRYLSVFGDAVVNVKLLRLVLSVDSIVLGQTIHSLVDGGAPPCDPAHWDARAPCRRFIFTAPVSGVLALLISWSGGSPLDAVIIDPMGNYLGISRELGSEQVFVDAFVVRGNQYEIRVSSYYDGNAFNLKADLTP